MTSRNQGLSSNDQGGQRRESLGTRLSLWRHHLTNFNILRTGISLGQKEIFENGKQDSLSYRLRVYVLK